jgi:murein DD-endopeptidase MepM/ murein hydrolase activator NlpD/pimeloyl-ACP methyl ester carboxylesterase
VERDTVSPSLNQSNVSLTAPGIKGEQVLAFSLTGVEAYNKVTVSVFKGGNQTSPNTTNKIKDLEYTLSQNGDYSSSNLMGYLACDEDGSGNGVTYTVKVKITDRANNTSTEVQATITTLPCPRCTGTSTGGWTNPIHDYRVRETSGHRTPERPNHNGVDLNVGRDANGNVISGIPIYAAKDGTVEYARYNYTDAERWTPDGNGGYLDTSNYVIINHGNGVKTHYVHFQYSQNPIVTIGQSVTINTVLGYMGNTGQSYGPHLHFGVFINGVDVDPAQPSILNLDGDDATANQQAKWCVKSGEGSLTSNQIDWQFDNKTQQPITLTFQKAWFGNGGNLESISGEANPQITRVVKKTDYILGVEVDPNLDEYKNQYKVFGIAPYQGQKVIIKLKDGNTIVETKEETLQTARVRLRKNCLNLQDQKLIDEKDHTPQNGRIEEQIATRWSGEVCSDNNKVTLQDEFWIDSYIKHITNCFGGECKLQGSTGGNYGTTSSRKKLETNTERLLDGKTGIESYITVTGENSDISDAGFSHTANSRTVKLTATTKDLTAIPANKKIWITMHGWNGDLNSPKKISEAVNDDSNIAFTLDWREVSHSGNIVTGGVCKAATWTNPLAIKIADKMRANGYANQEVVIVGHSLGTTLGRELSEQLGGNAKLIALDPPNESQCNGINLPGSGVRFNVKNNIPRKEYTQDTSFVRAYHGKGSEAGSKWYALGAIDSNNPSNDDAFRIDYNFTEIGVGAIHAATYDTYLRLIKEQKLQGNILDKNDQTGKNWRTQCSSFVFSYSCYDGFKGDISVSSKSINELRFYSQNNPNQQIVIPQ